MNLKPTVQTKPPLKRSTKWPYVILPILVIIVFILFVQNSYLKGVDDTRDHQIEQLQKTLDETKGQLNDIQRKQQENGTKIDGLDGGNDRNTSAPADTSLAPSAQNKPVATDQRANQPRPAPQNETQARVPVSPDKNPTLLCNPVLPLICQ